MAEYYTKPESDALFAAKVHDHVLEELGGTELPASRVAVPEEVSADFDDAFTMNEALVSIADKIAGKAASNHTHTGYAPTSHTHTPSAIGAATAQHTHDYAAPDHTHAPASIGAAAAFHTHDYAAPDHTHTPAAIGAAAESHTHTPAAVGAAPAVHTHDYAASGHSHTQTDITGLESALAAKAPNSALSAKADLVNGKVPESQLPSFVSDVLEYNALANFPATGESGKIYVATGTNKTYRWSGTQYTEISASLALGETSATAYRGDRGKSAYDHSQNGNVHITDTERTAWNGKAAGNHTHTLAALGAAAADHGHSYNSLTDKPTIPAAYSHPASHPASMIAGLSTVATSGKYSDLSDKPTIPTTLPANGGNADTVDNMHASDFALAGHNHDTDYIAKAFQMVSDTGSVEYEMAGLDVIATINGMPMGMHTGYCPVNSTNAPLSNESWRFLVHKTGSNYGWVLAFGSYGSVYSNYVNGGTWRGWKCIVDGTSAPLWKHESNGGFYMTANQTVTPSKPLDKCQTGWILMWSDYDPGTGVTNNADICTTTIPKRGPTGALWTGQGFLCSVPAFMNETEATNNTYLKKVYVHNDKLVGYVGNNVGNRRDVVLRAVYEF